MALFTGDPLVWGVVFLVVLVLEILVVANMKAQEAKKKGTYEATTAAPSLAEDESIPDLLSRFVEDAKGERVGETVGLDGDLVIIKSGTTYKAVPRKHLTLEDDVFKVHGVVSWDEAERLGAEWRKKQHRVVEYSEDEVPKDEPEA